MRCGVNQSDLETVIEDLGTQTAGSVLRRTELWTYHTPHSECMNWGTITCSLEVLGAHESMR